MTERGPHFRLYFVLDGKDYAYRTWPGVPPVGANVMMHPKGGPTVHNVLEVVWGVRDEELMHGSLTCNVKLGPPLKRTK